MARKAKYEVVRILAAVLIILNHVPCSVAALQINARIKDFFFLGGQFGVNLFVILSAWFLSGEEQFKASRVIRTLEEMVFFSLFLDGVSIALGYRFDLGSFLRSFSYWYPFGYVVMLLAVPYLARMTNATKKHVFIWGG